jgi:DNA-binding transcriptional LysR family regulator
MEWNDLKYVGALAEAGSVRRAGQRLGMHGATVARHVERLEARLGIKLFARTRQGMAATIAGRRVEQTWREIEAIVARLEVELRAEAADMAGPATLFVSEGLATGWLIPSLREFAARYPAIDLTLRSIEGFPGLMPGAAEAALVLTADPPPYVVGRVLGPIAICGYRSASTRPERQPLPSPTGERLLGPLVPDFADAWRAANREPAAEAPVHCPSLLAQFEAALAGLGIAVLPCVLGDAMRGLARVEPGTALPVADAWLLSHPESRGIARLQALLGYVQEIWSGDRARLEGRLTEAD